IGAGYSPAATETRAGARNARFGQPLVRRGARARRPPVRPLRGHLSFGARASATRALHRLRRSADGPAYAIPDADRSRNLGWRRDRRLGRADGGGGRTATIAVRPSAVARARRIDDSERGV